MSNEFIPSKKKSSKPPQKDPAELDGSLGYVSCTDIRNVWTHRIRSLDTDLWPRDGRTPYRDEMITFFETTMIELMQRAQTNYAQFCRRNPLPQSRSTQAPSSPPLEETPEAAGQRERYEARKAKLSQYNK